MSMQRLNAASAKLAYERRNAVPGIVHLGIGAFFRAHGAVYVDELLARDPRWGIIGVSLRRGDTRAALAPQDGLYTVAIRSGEGTQYRVVGSVLEVFDATAQFDRVIAALTDPRIRIVTLTVTEKGYCHNPATGLLDSRHPDIVHDLANPDRPASTPGLIVRALELRRNEGIAPFAVMSCDNLPANGKTTAKVVTGFAELRDADLAEHIRREVAFPSTMVDRIVPATTDEDRAAVARDTGFDDAWPVITEPFTQWVIEDRFPQGRPNFGEAGAEMVADVHDHELMKLRMLNGCHSSLAYVGYLSGYETVSEAMGDRELRTFLHDLLHEEVMDTLPGTLGDLRPYADALLARFANPALRHRTWQIAMDGSQKLPQRLLGTIRDRLDTDRSVDRLALGVAAWMRYATGTDENGNSIDVRDPFAERFVEIRRAADTNAEALVSGFLGIREIFDKDLANSPAFRTVLIFHLHRLMKHGAIAVVRHLNRSPAPKSQRHPAASLRG
jgi:fructuronate reductase